MQKEGPQALKTIPEAAFGVVNTPDFEARQAWFWILGLPLASCGLTALQRSLLFWAMGGIFCPQSGVLNSTCTSQVPRTQLLRALGPEWVWSVVGRTRAGSRPGDRSVRNSASGAGRCAPRAPWRSSPVPLASLSFCSVSAALCWHEWHFQRLHLW